MRFIPVTKPSAVQEFIASDAQRSLFPLRTNQFVIEHAEPDIRAYLRDEVLVEPESNPAAFLPQQRVYAEKSGYHLRRTVKLDPVAEYFLYDTVHRHRRLFRKSIKPSRVALGYRIVNGTPLAGTKSYRQFRSRIREDGQNYLYSVTFDIATYFNSIYHHDLVRWFEDAGAQIDEVNHLGQFLREANVGRSVDCLPQGIYPAKMLGHHFLRFVDEHGALRCDSLVRFMDDFFLFADDERELREDFYRVQELLGEKGLSINPAKTRWFDSWSAPHVGLDIDRVKIQLLQRRRERISEYDEDMDDEEDEGLSEEQLEYLKELLRDQSITEEDAELVLSLLDEDFADVIDHLELIIGQFPNLAKRVHSFCARVPDSEAVAAILTEHLSSDAAVGEYQLFWFACMLEDYLSKTSAASNLFHKLLDAPRATAITRAKVLEIPEKRFGMPDRREQYLRSGSSDWLTWSSAVGSRQMAKGARNQILKYMQKSSKMNWLVATAVQRWS